MGLLSCGARVNQMGSQPSRRCKHLEALAKLDELGHALVHFVLDDGLSLLCQPLLLVCNEVTECRNEIRGWLPSQLAGRSSDDSNTHLCGGGRGCAGGGTGGL